MSIILDTLDTLYRTREDEIESWLAAQREEAPPPLTCSVDLRHSGARVVPVDNNLYPAGFNNLSAAAELRAARFFKRFLEENTTGNRLLIVPENHTRNLAYLDNLAVLARILEAAGYQVRIGSLALSGEETVTLTSRSSYTVQQHALQRNGNTLRTADGFTPDVILLNNDCTAGPPPILAGLAQPVLPPFWMGWYRRRKSTHFAQYRTLATAFAAAFDLDPWLICADFHQASQIDFKAHQGLEPLARTVDEIIAQSRIKHAQHGIDAAPYVFVKADGGTYGMGIMSVHSGDEMLSLNKKERNKMQVVKEGAQVHEVIVQEGVATVDTVKGSPAEPMIYMVDGVPVGGMFRYNPQRDALGNLNAAGMEFTGMCDEGEPPDCDRQPVRECHFRAFGLIAALSALAAGREIKAMQLREAA